MRTIQTLEAGNVKVKLCRDSDWQEYQARLFVDGVEREAASYHTGDWPDVLATGKHMLQEAVAHAGMDEMAGI